MGEVALALAAISGFAYLFLCFGQWFVAVFVGAWLFPHRIAGAVLFGLLAWMNGLSVIYDNALHMPEGLLLQTIIELGGASAGAYLAAAYHHQGANT